MSSILVQLHGSLITSQELFTESIGADRWNAFRENLKNEIHSLSLNEARREGSPADDPSFRP